MRSVWSKLEKDTLRLVWFGLEREAEIDDLLVKVEIRGCCETETKIDGGRKSQMVMVVVGGCKREVEMVGRDGRRLRPCLDFFFFYYSSLLTQFPSLITHHPSLITHHLKHLTPFGTITHLSSLNIFQLFVGPTHWPNVGWPFSILFLFLFPPPLPFVFLFVFACFSLLFSSSMLTHILIKLTIILIFILFPDLQYNKMAIQ